MPGGVLGNSLQYTWVCIQRPGDRCLAVVGRPLHRGHSQGEFLCELFHDPREGRAHSHCSLSRTQKNVLGQVKNGKGLLT